MVDLVARRATAERGPAARAGAPRPRGPAERRPEVVPAVPPAGVELHRLLALARLSPPQALEIAAGVLAGAARWPEPDRGGPAGTPGPVPRIAVGVDGQVRVGAGATGGEDDGASAGGATGPSLGVVLADVAGSARRRAHPADRAPDPLVAALDRAGADLPVDGAPAVARRLQDALAGTDREAVRGELAALVRAIRGDPGPARVAAAGGTPPRGRRAAPPRPPTGGRTRTGLRRLGAWVLSLLVIAGVVLVEVATLRDRIAADVGELLDAGRSGSASASAPPRPDGRPVPAFAPAAAGAVTSVDLRPLARCAPGAPCGLRVLVQLAAAPDQRVVAWSYRVVDRCTGGTYTLPGGTVPVPASGDRAAAVGVVPLPALRAVAVVAVTDLPAAAASPPVLVGSCRSGP